MFPSAKAVFRPGYEKTPFRDYQELRARLDECLGTGEDNPFYRSRFEAGEYKLLLHVVACGRVFYEFLGRDPCRFKDLEELLVRGYFPRDLARCGAARVLKEIHD